MPVRGKARKSSITKSVRAAKPTVTWADVDVPAAARKLLQKIAADASEGQQVSKRTQAATAGGSNARVTLFAGENHAGKIVAAGALANHLIRPLQQVDLSKVLSKYIGETEKNLERIFHEAEAKNAILFFDEGDALFGKRSGVKDSHDRYANIEIAFLLQRLEAFHGVAVIATNDVKRLDAALKKLCGYVVRFPRPPAK